jgi:hypothetical protein
METQTQNSIRYSIVSTIIAVSKNFEIGRIIGRKGRNIRPIEERTCTHIHVIDNTNPTQIEIKAENISSGNGIDEAICQINNLLEDIEIRDQRKELVKEEKNVRFSNNDDYQQRNHNDDYKQRNHNDDYQQRNHNDNYQQRNHNDDYQQRNHNDDYQQRNHNDDYQQRNHNDDYQQRNHNDNYQQRNHNDDYQQRNHNDDYQRRNHNDNYQQRNHNDNYQQRNHNDNYQHRNHNDNDLKEEGKRVRRKNSRTTKKRRVRYFKNI